MPYPSPLVEPTLRADLPSYPAIAEILRVTPTTVPGPSGYGSSSVLGPVLYVGSVCQLRTDTLLPRDRIPCLVDDLNGVGLAPGYYTNGRLSGSYTGLPVYAVGAAGIASGGFTTGATGGGVGQPPMLPGLTQNQWNTLILNLTPQQISQLVNLTPCQLQTLLTSLNVSQMWELTTNLTSTQITTLVDGLTSAQLLTLVTTLGTPLLQILTSSLTPIGVQQLEQVFTADQIKILLQNLSISQLQNLVKYPPNEMLWLYQNNTIPQIENFLSNSPTAEPSVTSASGPSTTKLASDFTTSSGTFVDVTGLSFSVAANRDYAFDFILAYRTSGANLPSIAINGPASPTQYSAMFYPNSAGGFTQQTVYDTGAALASNTTRQTARITGVLRNGSNAGTLIVRILTPSGSVTVLEGSGGTIF